jgi:hypothetical protein
LFIFYSYLFTPFTDDLFPPSHSFISLAFEIHTTTITTTRERDRGSQRHFIVVVIIVVYLLRRREKKEKGPQQQHQLLLFQGSKEKQAGRTKKMRKSFYFCRALAEASVETRRVCIEFNVYTNKCVYIYIYRSWSFWLEEVRIVVVMGY